MKIQKVSSGGFQSINGHNILGRNVLELFYLIIVYINFVHSFNLDTIINTAMKIFTEYSVGC